MSSEARDTAPVSYVRLCRSQPDGSVTELVLSRPAMHLHTFGVLSSIESGTPGFVSDRYLNSIRAETTMTALELCLSGLWERAVGPAGSGYTVSDADTMAVAQQLQGQLAGLAERCAAEGGHEVHAGGACARCGDTGRHCG